MKGPTLVRLIKEGKFLLKIYIKRHAGAYLRPVRINKKDASRMARWRRKYYKNFFTWVKPDSSELLQWLNNYKDKNNDIIFMIVIRNNTPIGQFSLYNIDFNKQMAEFGRLIHGRRGDPKSIILKSIQTLLEWAFESLHLKRISLEVFADNEKAISLYRKAGFKILAIKFFSKTKKDKDTVTWIPVTGKNIAPYYRPSCSCRKVYRMIIER